MDANKEPPQVWGSFTYTGKDGKKQALPFVKQGNDGERGVGGYVFGRRQECDFVLEDKPFISGRHFLLYKETVHDHDQKDKDSAKVVVFLKDLSMNGTFVNGAIVGVNKRVQLKDRDVISYANSHFKRKYGLTDFIFSEGHGNASTFAGQYEIGPKLGSGNFATVYHCLSRRDQTAYAVKVVDKRRHFSPKVAASLEREIGILMSINHPNLLRILSVFSEDDYYYVVTELARDGELFDQIVDKQKFTENEARHIFRQVLAGVKYLHDRGIMHRDLKPENILVMDKEAMTVKISDFGLAKMTGEDVFINTMCGTPSYVAPEVLRRVSYGKAVDMWSLGVILYICLCGFPPFSDDLAPPNLRTQVLENLYTFPSPYWDDISDEAVDLIQGLLAASPEERLTVNEAFEHCWMHMEDGSGTFPSAPRTEEKPQYERMLSRVMTQRAEKFRGRNGFSQSQQLYSQPLQELPEDDENDDDDAHDYSAEYHTPTDKRDDADLTATSGEDVKGDKSSQQAAGADTPQSLDRYGSGIGIFSQEGMVRMSGSGTGVETDFEDDFADDHGHIDDKQTADPDDDNANNDNHDNSANTSGHKRDRQDSYGTTGDQTDGSYMSVQESFSNGDSNTLKKSSSMASVVMKEADDAGSNEEADNVNNSRPASPEVEEQRTTKRARTSRDD
ncbi:hypothetical protein BGW42_000842 [Actinomortierella wolfii]|nr:hypothetical protein BGW42_000842 [Actinomortierella wolfii]